MAARCSAALALYLAIGATPALGSDGTPGEDTLANQGVLELSPGADLTTVVARHGFTVLESIPSRGLHLVAFEPALTEGQFELLSDPLTGDPDITDSELNRASGDQGSGTQSMFASRTNAEFLNQPLWSILGVPAANLSATGQGITVAVIDSGIDTDHPMFAGRIHPGAINLLGDPADFDESGNGIDDDGDLLIDEMLGHGTFVAGIILGVAPDATILPIRVMNDEGVGDAFTVAHAVYYAIDHGADVINLSLGSEAELRLIEKAIDRATHRGIIVVASAGNEGETAPEYPAATNKVAGIAATDTAGVLAPFSNRGDHILFCAPGTQIIGPQVDGWGAADGTSAAAPLVAGTAALVIERGTVLHYEHFRSMARKTAIDIEDVNPGIDEDFLGFGLLNVQDAVAWTGPCFADLAEDDLLNVDDINAFITLFLAGDEHVDLAEPRGVLNVNDIEFFVDAFLGGCPIEGP
ncbi:MAG: hypothetical protein DHS20C14_17480 [Phycisphaeraceae bacterium]|nr:MAG: hypothetical protein DHS20C14_17480 [Phycisphaeraceae bacterium]